MKKARVAVEDGLSNIKEMLKEEGYNVVSLEESGSKADAVVITGMDKDMAGYSNILTEAFLIDASGRPPEEILDDLDQRFRLRNNDMK